MAFKSARGLASGAGQGVAPPVRTMAVVLPFLMAIKLSTRQQSQLAFLNLLPPKFARCLTVIEQMGGGGKVDESVVRGMVRIMDEIKAGSSQLKMNGLADAAANMAAVGRRGGGLQVKVRALREALASVRMNHDSATKKASIPVAAGHPDADPEDVTPGGSEES
jgi:hypothetical protein